MNKVKSYIVGLHSPRHTNSINNITFIQKHSRYDYGTKIKINPKCNIVPDRPNWEPLLIIWDIHVVTTRVFIELPLELGHIIWNGSIGPCIWFGSNL